MEDKKVQNKVDWVISNIDGDVLDITWCKESQHVLVLTDKNHVYHSTNRGKTWVSLKNQFINNGAK